ncbi:putative heme iron utilization protein [Ochrobactrum pecoris]|uniref:Heme iron utilization protein n=1 Tax=Brucella pecoris TaxID=867683 RepID=A0AB34YZB8_9HYPH|nr:putative heme iron utilization protein [Brucella pecoris]
MCLGFMTLAEVFAILCRNQADLIAHSMMQWGEFLTLMTIDL